MKKKQFAITIFILLLLIVIILNIIMSLLNGNKVNENVTTSVAIKEPSSVRDIIENNESEYIKEEQIKIHNIHVNFKYDLYDENGLRKEDYFDKIIKELVQFKKGSFNIIDEKKDINIKVIYDEESGHYDYLINNQEDYYRLTDGKVYSELNNINIIKEKGFYINNVLLNNIINNGMHYNTRTLGERTEIDEKYGTYQDGTIKTRNFAGTIRNIIFLEGYEETIVSKVKVGTPLRDIAEKYENIEFGSLVDRYLGYITSSIYIFFYDNEISIYGFSYKEHTAFEIILEEYLKNRDLSKFVKDVTKNWPLYDVLEYDEENKNVRIEYPSRGVEIDIKNNNPEGITLYRNYYFTDRTKRLVKDKIISFNPEDYIHISEINRKKEEARGM